MKGKSRAETPLTSTPSTRPRRLTGRCHTGKKTGRWNGGGYLEFTLGERKVVAGWESALPKLRVGDQVTVH